MSKYLVKLKSLGTFFFGKEDNYRKKRSSDELTADYFQRSAYFPQQTTLLGTLRFALLQKNEQIPVSNTELAEELIGKQSFRVQDDIQAFGKIKGLSPVFIADENNEFYFQNPKDIIIKDGKKMYLKRSEKTIRTSLGEINYFPDYVEKEGLSDFLLSSEGNVKKFLPSEGPDRSTANDFVFIEEERIGITKNERDHKGGRKHEKLSKAAEEGFYKKIQYRFNTGFCFAFYADIDDDLHGHSEFVSMGADKSPFLMSFESLKNELNEVGANTNKSSAPKIILMSDTYISDYDPQTDLQFAISSTKTFRFLKTEVKEGNKYYSSDPLVNRKGNIQRSKKFNLFERGSVFFFKDEEQMEAFEQKIRSEANFCRIGYNHFLTIK